MKNMTDMIAKINNFSKTITGNPDQQLQNFIRNNNVPQAALDYAQQQANMIYQVMKNIKRH